MFPTVIGWVASAAYLVRLVPQPVRLWRTGVPDGVSPLSSLIATVGIVAWLAYGLMAGLPPVWVVSVVALPPALATMALLRRQLRAVDVQAGMLWIAALVLSWRLGFLGVLLAVEIAVQCAPQVWQALRSRALDGLSRATWIAALVDAGLWALYGAGTGDGALIGYGAVLGASATFIVVRLGVTRRAGAIAAA